MDRKMAPSHPGAILREDVLGEYNLSITKAAEGLHVSRKTLSEIVNESAAITPEMALRLHYFFGIDAKFWLDMQKNYDLWKITESGKVKDIHRYAIA